MNIPFNYQPTIVRVTKIVIMLVVAILLQACSPDPVTSVYKEIRSPSGKYTAVVRVMNYGNGAMGSAATTQVVIRNTNGDDEVVIYAMYEPGVVNTDVQWKDDGHLIVYDLKSHLANAKKSNHPQISIEYLSH